MSVFQELDRLERVGVVRATARLYRRGLEQKRPLDAVVATFLREDLRGTRRPLRGVVALTAHAMWRRRSLLSALEQQLEGSGIPASPEALVMATLLLDAADPDDVADALPMERSERSILRGHLEALPRTLSPADRFALSPWLFARLADLGGEALAATCLQAPPQTLRVNTLKISRDALQADLAAEGIRTTPTPLSDVGLHVVGHEDVFRTAAFHHGHFEVQDEGSQLVAATAAARPGQLVVDGCAGAGGKTLALAAAMAGTGQIHAFDIHAGRLRALRERARRAGAHNIRAVHLETDPKARKRLKGRADLVLVDAPCSGTGVLRRNPDTGWSLGAQDVDRLVQLQAQLLRDHAPLVRPGGRLVYATCSLLPEENIKQIEIFQQEHPEFQLVGVPLATRPDQRPVDAPDGLFAATLERTPG